MKKWLQKLLCAKGYHKFIPYERRSKTHVYYMRECGRCGYTERQNAGARGDGKWRDAESPIRLSWEREDFKKSVRI
jgi:predicted nucleic-acid-binding Zn-ribbon protein